MDFVRAESAGLIQGGSIMPASDRKLIFERLYSIEELIELRRQMLRYA